MARLILICALLVPNVCALQVQLRQGTVRGLDVETPFGRTAAFLGVPYAQPPVGALRFAAPRPPLFSDGIYNATEKKFSCPGPEISIGKWVVADFGEQDEDCLYLNIWAPANASNLPVVLYIHGGIFVAGSGGWFPFDGTRLAPRADIVYITMNMRLGVLGFINLPVLSDTNVGLLDIVRAVHWVHENAEAFGGNPEQLTLWGQSAGAISIDFLLKSDAISGLVRRAILEGGSAGLAKFLLEFDGEYESRQLAYTLGCSSAEPDGEAHDRELLSCLREVPWQDIIKTRSEGGTIDKVSIQPFIDGKLLKKDVVASPHIDPSVEELFVVSNELEAFLILEGLVKKLYETNDITSIDWGTILKISFKVVLRLPYEKSAEIIRRYIPDDVIDESRLSKELREIEIQRGIASMFTDSFFYCPAEFRSATAGDRGVRVSRGEFHFRPDFSFVPKWASMSHAEEIALMHGNLDLYKPGKGLSGAMMNSFVNVSRSDYDFSDVIVKWIGDFFHGR
ncbi:acetylcholinesterase-1-like [Galendromus occidentalis]|uniref:Carboxylic ester hydrolase n=1 Tax=Galendromus occidentalis TaxID=34638 RepID=A0AAJ7L371_9ACAR|nr:acetylcholinesterase-1-like [Galendromus occidentalis]